MTSSELTGSLTDVTNVLFADPRPSQMAILWIVDYHLCSQPKPTLKIIPIFFFQIYPASHLSTSEKLNNYKKGER